MEKLKKMNSERWPKNNPTVVLDESFQEFRAEKNGPIVVVYPHTKKTIVGARFRW